MNEPLVSIVIPVSKDQENYLSELIDSIDQQSYPNQSLHLGFFWNANLPKTAVYDIEFIFFAIIGTKYFNSLHKERCA